MGSSPTGPRNGVKVTEQPRRDSNPCRHLERVVRNVRLKRPSYVLPGQPLCSFCPVVPRPSHRSEWMDKRMDNSQCSGRPRDLAGGTPRSWARNSKSSRLWDQLRSSAHGGVDGLGIPPVESEIPPRPGVSETNRRQDLWRHSVRLRDFGPTREDGGPELAGYPGGEPETGLDWNAGSVGARMTRPHAPELAWTFRVGRSGLRNAFEMIWSYWHATSCDHARTPESKSERSAYAKPARTMTQTAVRRRTGSSLSRKESRSLTTEEPRVTV
jgi:hypothetical protein